jgi:hypothetical protein
MVIHFVFLALSYVVTTVAGSGSEGIADGPARTATFMKPVGIATDAAGNIYVADAAAQRIRIIERDGVVSTLAGSGFPAYNGMWVDGGYRDGPAASARFNRPSGVAVDARGVFVADTLNHCIRLIHDGLVTTYAGSPTNVSAVDGPIASAGFIRPRALAFDAGGDLYVLDNALGLRRIHDGVVTTIPVPGVTAASEFLSLAFIGSRNAQRLVIGTGRELLIFDRDMTWLRREGIMNPSIGPAYRVLYDLRGNVREEALDTRLSIGPAFGIAPLSDGSFVYSDTRTHSLRTLEPSAFPDPLPDADDWDGGYRNGAIQSALFNAPTGLAALADGSVIVADTGNRRIRKVTPTSTPPRPDPPLTRDLAPKESRNPGAVVAGEEPFPAISDRYYRIAYLGNSYIYYNTRWPQSIPGLVEASLRSKWQALGFPREPKLISVAPMRGLDGFHDFIDNILATGVVDAVVMQLNSANISDSFPPQRNSTTLPIDQAAWERVWRQPLLDFLRNEQKELAAAGIPLVVVVNPLVFQVSPNECPVQTEIASFQDWMFLVDGPPGGNDFHDRIIRVLGESAVPYIDLLPAVLAAEDAADRPSLFGTVDGHYSRYGRTVVAAAVTKAFIAMHPWKPQVKNL